MKKKARRRKKSESELELTFSKSWKAKHGNTVVREYKFHPTRMWRFDFAFPSIYLAIEIQGYGRGHTSYTGMYQDYQKHNSAIRMGWTIIYLMSEDLKEVNIDKTLAWIHKLVQQRRKQEWKK